MVLLSDHMDDSMDEIRRMKEQIDKMLEPQRRMREQMERMIEPYRRASEHYERWIKPAQRIYEQANSMSQQHLRMLDQIKKLSEPQRLLQQQISTWITSVPSIHNHIQQMQESLSHWSLPNISSELGLKYDDFINYQNAVKKTYENYLGDVNKNEIRVDKSGCLSVAGNMIDETDLNSALQNIVSKINDIPSPLQVIEVLSNALSKLKRPIAIVIIYLIFPILLNISANLFTPYIQDVVSGNSHESKREQVKAIRREAADKHDAINLAGLRFVTADILNVRKKGTAKSQCLDKIYFGQVVVLLQKGRHWSYIQYTNDNSGEDIQGWVFNRYLAKFKK